ncbi:hypothetical protein [Sulfurimonas diazotrophicus]|uniref:Uncharacterized protein n=1 Tax=Sulfurimonas diazotrophicus TaxID=3131939 RepID=A0ABZ3H9S2_9BACT
MIDIFTKQGITTIGLVLDIIGVLGVAFSVREIEHKADGLARVFDPVNTPPDRIAPASVLDKWKKRGFFILIAIGFVLQIVATWY